ncbi:MAG: 6-bladed beta-propeller [Patescibacteria group bacterium]
MKNLKFKLFISFVIVAGFIAGAIFFQSKLEASIGFGYLSSFGNFGTGDGFLFGTTHIATDSNGDIYVSEGYNNFRVQKFNSSGAFIFKINASGSGNGQFDTPAGIAIDSANNFFVVDVNNHRVQKFNSAGTYMSQFGTVGTGNGQFLNPYAIAIDSADNVYVSDRTLNYIQKFDSSGAFVSIIADGGVLGDPVALAVDSSDNLFIGDSGNLKIKKYDSSGVFVSEFGSAGSSDGEFNVITGIAIDSSNNIYVSDFSAERIQKFDSSGAYLSNFGGYNYGNTQSYQVSGIAVNASDNVYAIDAEFLHIVKYGLRTVPDISSITPDRILSGANNFTVIGADFSANSAVFLGGFGRPTTYIDSSHLQATITGLSAGIYTVNVYNPTPIGVISTDTASLKILESQTIITPTPFTYGNVAGLDGYYDFSYSSTQTGTINTITITFPAGFTIEDSNGFQLIDPASVLYNGCVYLNIDTCLSVASPITTDVGNRKIYLNVDDGIGSAGVDVEDPYSINFSITNQVITNPTLASDKDASGFSLEDDLTGAKNPSSPVTIVAGPVDHFTFNTIADNVVDALFDVVIYARDIYENTNYDFADTVDITSTGSITDGNFTTDNFSGGAVLTKLFSFVSAGSFNVTATNTNGPETGTSNTFNITAPSVGGGGPGPSGGGGTGGSGFLPPPVVTTPPPVILPPKVIPPPSKKNTVTYKKPEIVIPPPITPEPVIKKEIPKPIIPETKTLALISVLAALSTLPFSNWRSLFSIFAIRKRKSWGVVYDSITKQALDPAYVVLQDLEGNEVATSITDLDGRFGFLAKPGTYKLVANKTNYLFPSARLAERTQDELYADLYFGEQITIQKKGEVIIKNIPMDPVNFDWNEFAKKQQNLLKFSSKKKDVILKRVSGIVFWSGFSISVIASYIAPAIINLAIIALYVVLFALRNTILKPTPQGSVTEKESGRPLSFAIIRVFSIATNTEIIHKVTDENGIYFCLIPNGKYLVQVEKKNSDGSYIKVAKEEVTVSGGVMKFDFKV